MTGLLDDLRYGVRGLTKNRGFALAAVLSLALGIGANTTIFTLLNAIFLRPLPVRDPAHLAAVFTTDPRIPGQLLCSYPNYQDYRDHNTVFSSLLLYSALTVNLTGRGDPQLLMGQLVSTNYFATLGVVPVVGRGFRPEEELPGATPVAVISHALWLRLFDGSPDVTRRTIEISGHPYGIVGVAPAEFQGLSRLSGADVFLPFSAYPRVYPNPGIGDAAARPAVCRRGASQTRRQHTPGRSVLAEPGAGTGTPVSAGEPGAPDQPDDGRRSRAQCAHPSGDVAGRGGVDDDLRPGAADCMRQCRQPAAGAGHRAAQGDRDPAGDGRQPRAADPAVADGERPAGAGRRRRRPGSGKLGARPAVGAAAAGIQPCGIPPGTGFAGDAVHRGHLPGDGSAFRTDARFPGDESRPGNGFEGTRQRARRDSIACGVRAPCW